MTEGTKKTLEKMTSGRLFVVVSVLSTFCLYALLLVLSDATTEIKLAVFGTLSTLAASIEKDYFNRDRSKE